MATGLQKVAPGDPLEITAEAYNAFVEAALYVRRQQQDGRRGAAGEAAPGVVWVRNDSEADRARFDVLGIGGVLIEPLDNFDEFCLRPSVSGVVPTEADRMRFVLLLEPVADGAIGRAAVYGLAAARVDVQAEDDAFAEAVEGECGFLQSIGSAGGAQILWKEAGTGERWALLRLGGGGGGLAWKGELITCDNAAGTAMVRPDGAPDDASGDVKCYNTLYPWHRPGDRVLVVPFAAGTEIECVGEIIQQIQGSALNKPPTGDAEHWAADDDLADWQDDPATLECDGEEPA